MFGGRPAAGAPNGNAKKPTIRRETAYVPVKKQPNPNGVKKPASSSTRPPTNRFQLSDRAGVKSKTSASSKKPQAPAQRAIAASRGLKRKSTTPERVLFSSDDEDDDSEIGASDSDASRKRLKSSASSVESSGPKRDLVLEAAFDGTEPEEFLHGADCTSSDNASKFKNPWELPIFQTVELQYPSNTQRELFELKWPKNEKDDYKPMEDIIETIKHIAKFYFPDELSEKWTNEATGFGRRFNRAWIRKDISEFKSIVAEFNSVVTDLVKDGTIRRELASRRQLPLELIKRIMDQIYARTVSPKVETLRAYQNGSDNVYGELLSRFCSAIFHQIKLNQSQVFVDLGSGVGNVVLQAALEVGCESWGIEMMKNPCDLAQLQAKEFPGRTHLWGINVGKVNLIRGNFTTKPDVAPVLQRADVVLVNNQAFTPELNDKLINMFLDLKDGCQVVSLKPFVPEGHKISMRNIGSVANLFMQQRFEYFSGSVSWTDQSGYYYIATKDPAPLEKFMKEHGAR